MLEALDGSNRYLGASPVVHFDHLDAPASKTVAWPPNRPFPESSIGSWPISRGGTNGAHTALCRSREHQRSPSPG